MRLPLYRQTRAYLQDTCPAYSEPSNDPFLIENSENRNNFGSEFKNGFDHGFGSVGP